MSAQYREIDPLSCLQNIRIGSSPLTLCPCGQTINLEKIEVFAPKSADARI